jgi:glucose uptake protein GlcU
LSLSNLTPLITYAKSLYFISSRLSSSSRETYLPSRRHLREFEDLPVDIIRASVSTNADDTTMTFAGFVLAFASAACNGSFAAFQKLPQVQRAQPHPIVFNAFVSLGVVASSALATPFLPLVGYAIKFNVLGALAGALFVLATLFSFLAIPRLGLAMAQGTWGGAALLTAFLWGVLGPEHVGLVPKNWGGSLGGVLMLVTGVVGMVYHADIARRCCGCCGGGGGDTEQGAGAFPSSEYPEEDSSLLDLEGNSGRGGGGGGNAARGRDFCLGITFALFVGLFGGSVNVPSELTKSYGETLQGLETMPSFGIGTLCMGLIVPLVYFKVIDRNALEATGGVHWRALWLPGLLSGTIWNLGNVCSVYANDSISFAVAQPLMQCALLVSGILGIFVFEEIKGRGNILTFFAFAAVLLLGAALLAVFGPSP